MNLSHFDSLPLLQLARKTRNNAYTPYFRFPVGAALLCDDGTIFCGANVEVATGDGTICAERAAVAGAISAGKRNFVAIAVSGHSTIETPPCGICRQVLAEFSPKMKIICGTDDNYINEYRLDELLPHSFSLPEKS